MDALAQIARTLLYEGYLLWPYRRSAPKNRQRWTFGGVVPQAFGAARENEPWAMQAECLLEVDAASRAPRVDVQLRFLHVVERQVARGTSAWLEPVDELRVGSERHLSWDEATEREIVLPAVDVAAIARRDAPLEQPLAVAAGSTTEPLTDADGALVGAIVRSWRALEGSLALHASRVAERLFRITVRVVNTTPWAGATREDAMRQALVSTHLVLRVAGGAWVSLTDPPPAHRTRADACRNVGVWPVLVGEPGERHTLLASPIILADYPQVAPESPGDLFDGGEIDQLLVLNVLSLTDEEREEMRATDPRAREILDRCASLTPEQRMRLHGTVRELRPLRHR